MWILIAALLLSTADDTGVTAKKLDGTTISGTLQSWQDGQLVLATPAGPQQIAEADLLMIQRSVPPASSASTDTRKPAVELVDGTRFPLAEFSTTGGKATIVPRMGSIGGSDQPQPLLIDLKKIKSVSLQSMSEALVSQWQEILATSNAADSATPSDLLVVVKRGGQSLDYLEGVIGQVTDRDIEFTHDGSSARVSREKVAGLIFYRANPPSDEPPRCVLTGTDDLIIRGANVRLDGENLQIATASGATVRWPSAEIASADFSAGKLVFLSDLKPALRSWQPLVALPASATHAATLGLPRFDHSAFGGPLSLWYPDGDQSPALGHAESFAKGLALRSRAEVVYRLPRGFNRFTAVVGIEPVTRSNGDVMLTVMGDDQSLWEHPVTGHDPPLPIELDIAGVKQLKIVVDYGKNLDTGDWLNLCDARIVK
ncbi:MAG TPA: NPCBM/NEW2 domain-containing protein [Lacipirellulaceae bacterium]